MLFQFRVICMPIRDLKKEKTAAKAQAAITRIVEGIYTNKTLKKRKKVKLNQSTVEMEAGLGVSSLRNHPDILALIENQNNPKGQDNLSADSSDIYHLQNQIIQLKKQKKELQKQKKELTQKYQLKFSKHQSLEDINKEIHADYIQLTSALFDLVPQEERQDLFEKLSQRSSSNVIQIKK